MHCIFIVTKNCCRKSVEKANLLCDANKRQIYSAIEKYVLSQSVKYTYIYRCGRKNNPIWESHSFGWGARTVVGSASSNSGVRAVFSVHHGVVGRTSSLYC